MQHSRPESCCVRSNSLTRPGRSGSFEKSRALALLAKLGADPKSGVTADEAKAFANRAAAAVVDAVNDTLYGSAWLDLSNEAFLLEVPDMGDRYFTFQMMDAFRRWCRRTTSITAIILSP